jgi:hypothetical protein
MRPLVAVESDLAIGTRFEVERVAMLLDALGPYCSICERPLLERAFPWSATLGATETRFARDSPGPWLVLCVSCEESQARSATVGPAGFSIPTAQRSFNQDPDDWAIVQTTAEPEPLLLPFDQVTFSVAPPRMFEYTVDGDVRVGDITLAAATTIRRFQLTGGERDDPRRVLRSRTWRIARQATVELAEGLRQQPAWLPELMVATGFLSLWIEALYGRFNRPEPVIDVLESGRRELVTFFPGTDWQALEYGHSRG